MSFLSEQQIATILQQGLNELALEGKRVLFIIPDGTRTMPLPLFFRLICDHLLGSVQQLDFLIALGTHPAMPTDAILKLIGVTQEEKDSTYQAVNIYNHAWQDDDSLTTVGVIDAQEIKALSGGLLEQDVPVRINRIIFDYDQVVICGPVFPHEVVGFSGGHKYLFPGICGADMIDFTHWLGALKTCYAIIGTKHTPVRAVIDRAATFINVPLAACCAVVSHEGVHGLFCGEPLKAWDEAATLSAQVHVRYVEKPFETVLSVMPAMYDEIWTGAKGMYKMEPVVADGGELIIYAPHIKEISVVHGNWIKKIGYHTRDYFLKQWDKFQGIPRGVIAHSTHLRGIGAYDAISGVESPRIRVTLATGIPEAECRALNLGWRDPASINVAEWQAKSDGSVLVVARAGEYLYRLRDKPLYVVMGVSGSGKSTVGRLLAEQLGCDFFDGDDYHPAVNVEKMRNGIPLTDDDRAGWLAKLASMLADHAVVNKSAVIACSALKESYRNILQGNLRSLIFVYLKGDYDTILARMQARSGHYMKPEMLQSQFATLEEPKDDITASINQSPEDIVNQILGSVIKKEE